MPSDRTFVSPRPLSHPCSHRHSSNLATRFCAEMTATAYSMEQALQEWRNFYQIEEEAYTQLHSPLQSFGIPTHFVHPTDGGHGNRILPESSMVDPSFFSAGPPNSGTTSRRYSNEALSAHFEPGTPQRGSLNQGTFAGPFQSAITSEGSPKQSLSVNLYEVGNTNEGFSDKGHSVGPFDMDTSTGE